MFTVLSLIDTLTMIASIGKRAFPRDIVPIFTADVAAITIQRKWRTILMLQFLQALCRTVHDEVWDPVHGQFNYYNRDHEELHLSKPIILRNEPWDPNHIPDWTIERVIQASMSTN